MPRTIIISFLGHLTYDLANYYYEDINQYCSSRYFLLAVHKFFSDTPIDMTYVVLTKEAREAHWDGDNQENLRHQLLKIEKPFAEIDIPSIQSTEGLWKMFAAIEQEIQEGDQIIFDITNSWRSQPVVALLIISFVKITKQANIKTLIYGSFDKASNNRNEPQPAYNLNSMAALLDWTTAVSTFQQTGRVENLAALAKGLGGEPVEQFAEQLQNFSQELLAARPVGTAWAASKLPELLEQVKDDSRPESTPLGLLLDSIAETYQQFDLGKGVLATLPAAYDQTKAKDIRFLEIQLDMIKWYVDKGLSIQARSLAREWLISVADYYQNTSEYTFDRKKREHIVQYIDNVGKHSRGEITLSDINFGNKKGKRFCLIEEGKRTQSNIRNIIKAWDSIRKIRNDIAHCGYDQSNAKEASKIQSDLETLYQTLAQLLPKKA